MLRAFVFACKRLRVEVKLQAMDALALCDYGLSESARFDAIDTSNLADNVELLNVILMAAPRLESHPAARWLFPSECSPPGMETCGWQSCRSDECMMHGLKTLPAGRRKSPPEVGSICLAGSSHRPWCGRGPCGPIWIMPWAYRTR